MPTLVCFGDSQTAKEESLDGYERLTPRLRTQLSNWTIVNSGVSGETTRAGLARLQDDVLRHTPDLVTILFGSNDASEHRKIKIEEYERNLEVMIDRITAERTILISPPPVNEQCHDKRTNKEIEAYANVVQSVASKRGCSFINFWSYLAQNELYKEMLLQDGLHLNERAYLFLSELILDRIKRSKKKINSNNIKMKH